MFGKWDHIFILIFKTLKLMIKETVLNTYNNTCHILYHIQDNTDLYTTLFLWDNGCSTIISYQRKILLVLTWNRLRGSNMMKLSRATQQLPILLLQVAYLMYFCSSKFELVLYIYRNTKYKMRYLPHIQAQLEQRTGWFCCFLLVPYTLLD